MFAGLRGFETSLRPSLRARRAADRRRASTARLIARILEGGGDRFLGRGPRYLIEPAVLAATADDLRVIRVALESPERPVPVAALRDLDAFLRDGADSPLHGRDPAAAADAARKLRERIAPIAEPKTVETRVAATAVR